MALALAAEPRPRPLCAARENNRFDVTHYNERVIVFPDADNVPSLCAEPRVRIAVAGDVGAELAVPPVGVVLGHRSVRGANVPEATVDEHDDLRANKEEIAPPPTP